MRYTVLLNKKIKKFIENVEKTEKEKIRSKLQQLSKNPLPQDAKKMRGKHRSLFRIRAGEFRILYYVAAEAREILVVKIDKRSKAYR